MTSHGESPLYAFRTCSRCATIPDQARFRQEHDGQWPGRPDLGELPGTPIEMCPECHTCYYVRIDPGGMVSDADADYERIDPVQSELIHKLLDGRIDDASAEALLRAGRPTHLEASWGLPWAPLLPALARALSRPGDRGWALRILGRAALEGTDVRAAFPALLELLSGGQAADVVAAARVLEYCARRGLDISPAVSRLKSLEDVGEESAARAAAEALRAHREVAPKA